MNLEQYDLSKQPDPERLKIVSRGMTMRREIEQIFIDIASWNDNSEARKNGCEPIDPDPDGKMRRMADGLDKMLENEKRLGYL